MECAARIAKREIVKLAKARHLPPYRNHPRNFFFVSILSPCDYETHFFFIFVTNEDFPRRPAIPPRTFLRVFFAKFTITIYINLFLMREKTQKQLSRLSLSSRSPRGGYERYDKIFVSLSPHSFLSSFPL